MERDRWTFWESREDWVERGFMRYEWFEELKLIGQ
jgi:hypothetical protein